MVEMTGSDTLGGVNQSDVNEFDDSSFWFEWVLTINATSLTAAGFDISDGSISPTTTIYNAGSTDNLDGLVGNASASSLDNQTFGDFQNYGVRVTTSLNITNAGTYTFDVLSDDGMRLFVDGIEVVEDDIVHAPRTATGSIALTPGEHEVVIIYFERNGENVLEVDIQSDAGGDYPTQVRLQDADVQANAVADIINSGQGNDIIDSGAGDDTIDAGAGNDTIDAGTGNDTVDGGTGNDIIDGGAGNDTLDGGTGIDTLTGGDGSDLFIWDGATNGTITDFGTGNTGTVGDADTVYTGDNDFVDLSGIFNPGTLAAYNAAAGTSFGEPLQALNHDLLNGVINFNGTDFTGPTLTLAGVTSMTTDESGVTCFTSGTLITTPQGKVPVEDISVGEHILTSDRGVRQIRWIGRRKFDAAALRADPGLRPVRITAGALGNGLPERDLLVSRQHRMLISSRIAEKMFGTNEILIAAIKLTELPGIYLDEDLQEVEYFHMLFDQHEIILAEGAPTESFFTGSEALRMIGDDAKEEIFKIFPEARNPKIAPAPARYVPSGKLQKKLLARHSQNQQELLQTY